MKKFLIGIVCFCLFFSCNNNNKSKFTHNIQQIEGKSLFIDCFIGVPYSITFVDSLLLFYDRHEGKTITIYDLQNEKCVGREISEGKGPGEVIVPIDLLSFPQQDELYLFQRQTGYLNTYSISDRKMTNSLYFQEKPFDLQRMQDYYIGTGLFEQGRFGIYDLKGNMLRTDGQYPFEGEAMDVIPRYVLYQSYYCAKPDGNSFVMGSLFCDNIEFYEVKDNETTLLKKYESIDIKARYSEQLIIDDACTINYTWAYGTSKYCYMLYSGKTYLENDRKTGWGNTIIVFDWKGNHIRSFATDVDILTFCVDELKNRIYAVALDYNGEYGIRYFNL